MLPRTLALLPLVFGVLMYSPGASAHDHAKDGACAAAAQQPVLIDARESLQRTPKALKSRLALADVLIEAGCYEEAVHVLEDGAEIHPGNAELNARMRTASSLIKERQFFAGLDQAELEAKLARHVLRCTRLGDVSACDEALALKADNPEVLLAKGEALLKAGKPLQALETYKRAAALRPADSSISAKLQQARDLRVTLDDRCMSGAGDAALTACQAILLKDAPEEFHLTRRIAVLQQLANQPTKALDTYIAANSLRRGDKSVALAIVALVESTGRSDAIALAARGSALVALGRVRDGIASMRQAQSLTSGLPGIANQIAAAEKLLLQEERVRETRQSATASAATLAATPTRTYSNLQPPSHSN
jgi:tetratricopeptide (TPR) repeat protein